MSTDLHEVIKYIQAALSKIKFKLAAFFVTLSQNYKEKVHFFIPKLHNTTICYAMLKKSFSNHSFCIKTKAFDLCSY